MPETHKDKGKAQKPDSFEGYVKKHGEEEAVPFDDVLKKLVSAKTKQKVTKNDDKQ